MQLRRHSCNYFKKQFHFYICRNLAKTEQHRKTWTNLKPNSMRNSPNLLKLPRKYRTIIYKLFLKLRRHSCNYLKKQFHFYICRNLTKTEQHRKTSTNLKPNSMRNGPNLFKLLRKYRTIIYKLFLQLRRHSCNYLKK